MKLVAVSRVRNEADIVEPFVRHHAAYFNKIIVLDDGSSDGTFEILQALQAEGLPLVVLQAPAIGYEQSRYMTLLLRIAVDQFGADWIAPVDADEFIEPEAGRTVADVLEKNSGRLLSIAWHNFEWHPNCDEDPEPNPVIKQRRRLPGRTDHTKILIPASLVGERSVLEQGNHRIINDGDALASLPLQSIALGHFPIRSTAQYASKIAIGYLQYLSMPNWDGQVGFHYKEPFETLLEGGIEALKQRMMNDARQYSINSELPQNVSTESRLDPLRYQGGPLKYTKPVETLLQNVLQYAQSVARDRANLAWYLAAKPIEKDRADHQSNSSLGSFGSPNDGTMMQRVEAARAGWERPVDNEFELEMRLAESQRELIHLREKLHFQAQQLDSRTFKFSRYLVQWLNRLGLRPGAILDFISSLRQR